jgi:hypothetical protein
MNLYTLKILVKDLSGNFKHELTGFVVADSIEAIVKDSSYKPIETEAQSEVLSITLTKQDIKVIQ